ncbi:MAG: universal stress protein [Planctomycetaceae bacterium]
MWHIRTILVPTDFSDGATQALQVARSLARDHQAKLVLMSAPLPPPTAPEVYVPITDFAGLTEGCRGQLTQLAQSTPDIPVETAVSLGLPGPSIVDSASRHHADLIVMGSHGRCGLSRLLLGSVAEYVLRNASCPVLTIKPSTVDHLCHQQECSLSASGS